MFASTRPLGPESIQKVQYTVQGHSTRRSVIPHFGAFNVWAGSASPARRDKGVSGRYCRVLLVLSHRLYATVLVGITA